MKHRISRNPLNKKAAHRKAMLSNLAVSLFRHGSLKTSRAKAKVLQIFIERIITQAKQDTVHNRRQIWRVIKDNAVLNHIFTVVAPHYLERCGGYSRIVKCGRRRGDDAPMALLSLVSIGGMTRERNSKPEEVDKSSKQRGSAKKNTNK